MHNLIMMILNLAHWIGLARKFVSSFRKCKLWIKDVHSPSMQLSREEKTRNPELHRQHYDGAITSRMHASSEFKLQIGVQFKQVGLIKLQ